MKLDLKLEIFFWSFIIVDNTTAMDGSCRFTLPSQIYTNAFSFKVDDAFSFVTPCDFKSKTFLRLSSTWKAKHILCLLQWNAFVHYNSICVRAATAVLPLCVWLYFAILFSKLQAKVLTKLFWHQIVQMQMYLAIILFYANVKIP